MQPTEHDEARGNESKQVYLLSEVKKTQGSHSFILLMIVLVMGLQMFNQYMRNKADLEISKISVRGAQYQLEAEKAKLKADEERYKGMLESFNSIYTRLQQVEKACTNAHPR